MKAIYAKDIKAMVKQFDLNEAESDYLNDIAEAINKERTDLCEDIQMTLLYGSYSKSKRNALDRIDITQLTCSDASKIIGGLLSLIKCNRFVAHGCKVSNSPMFLKALDDVFDTIDKYQQQA